MDLWESTATGGSTTTVVDTKLGYPDGYFSDQPRGTLFLDLTTKATKIITQHATSTITFTPAQSGAVAPGDVYMACPGIYPKHILEQSIKMGLKRIGKIPYAVDVAMVADQSEWDNTDDDVFDLDIIGIEFANASSQPYNWTPHYRWEQLMLSTRKTLVFYEGAVPKTTDNMRIYYLDDHPALTSLTTEISTFINPDRLLWSAMIHALRWRIQRLKMVSDSMEEIGVQFTEAQQNLQEARGNLLAETQEALANAEQKDIQMAANYPIVRRRTPHHARW